MQDLVAEYQQYQEAGVEDDVEGGDLEMDADYAMEDQNQHQYDIN
jgi:hypothetical protein